MAPNPILKLPPEIRHQIYELAYGREIVIEICDDGVSFKSKCPMLRADRASREDVLTAYTRSKSSSVTILWTFRSPQALASHFRTANLSRTDPRFQNIQLVLLEPLGNGSSVCRNSLCQKECGQLCGRMTLFNQWRGAIRIIPTGTALHLVSFNLARPWRSATFAAEARLVSHLSFVLWHRAQRQARFRIDGCRTPLGHDSMEKAVTVGALHHTKIPTMPSDDDSGTWCYKLL